MGPCIQKHPMKKTRMHTHFTTRPWEICERKSTKTTEMKKIAHTLRLIMNSHDRNISFPSMWWRLERRQLQPRPTGEMQWKKNLMGCHIYFFKHSFLCFNILSRILEALLNLWVSTLRSKKVPIWPASTDTSKETTSEKAQASWHLNFIWIEKRFCERLLLGRLARVISMSVTQIILSLKVVTLELWF